MPKDSTIPLEALPQYSAWPSRLLGIEPWRKRRKTPEEITREFDREKWNGLLREARRLGGSVTIEKIEQFEAGEAREYCCWDGGRLRLLTPRASIQRQMATVGDCLASYLPASALVELGCGYGAVLLKLARRKGFRGLPLFGGEFTDNGRKLTRLLGEALCLNLSVGACDLRQRPLTDLRVPAGAVIYTSYAAHYAPRVKRDFVKGFLLLKPKVVVHFEPFLEHYPKNDLRHLLVRRYIEVNDYNTNLLTVLKDAERAGEIVIVEERPAVFGSNPLLPMSVVAWRPATQ